MIKKWRLLSLNFIILAAVGLVFFIPRPVHAAISLGDIISFWTLDETSPGTYSDSVGDPANDGAEATFAPDPTTNGQINGAQLFTASETDQITVPDDNDDFDWGVDDSFSIEFWMKGTGTTAASGDEVMIGRDDPGSSLTWYIGVQNSDKNVAFNLADSDGGQDIYLQASPAVDVTDGEWHHIVCVRDAGTAPAFNDGKVRLYVDNAVTETDETFDNDFVSTAAITLGWYNVGPGYYLNGTLDEVAIYNRALTADEVAAHFNATGGPRYVVDLDTDGVSDGEENAAPNNGDGDNDGTADMNQNTVASLLSNNGTDYVTIKTSAGTLDSCAAVANPSAGDAPSDTTFDWGFFNFTINGTASATVTMYLPTGASPDTYYKYGPPTPGETDAWYEFMDDGTTGATINSNIVTLKFVDGDRGDDTGVDNSIVDQGGPATVTSSSTTTPTSGDGGGGGGGCFISTVLFGN